MAAETGVPAPRRSRLRQGLGTLALLGFGCAAALLLAEVGLRLHSPVVTRLRGDRITLPSNVRQVFTTRDNPKLDPVIAFNRNAIGFRGPDPPRDFDDWLTIVAVGGSTTECLYLSEGKSWPEQLGARLEQRFDRIWINNAGLDGHTSYGHLMLLDQILVRLRPRLILFLVGLNDIGREGPKGRDQALESPSLLTRIARHSAAAAFAQNLLRFREAWEEQLPHREIDVREVRQIGGNKARSAAILAEHRERFVPGFRERLRELARTCRRAGIEPVFLTQPALYGRAADTATGVWLGLVEVDEKRHIHGGLAWRILDEYNDATRDVGLEQDVLVIDAARRMPKDSRLYYDFVHFTNEGAARLASIAVDELRSPLASRYPALVRSAR